MYWQTYSCPSLGCQRIMDSFAASAADLLKCPLPITDHVDARPAVVLSPGWRLAQEAPYEEAVMTKAQWQECFIQPKREGLMFIGSRNGFVPFDVNS